jgi:general secretion pathway protein L
MSIVSDSRALFDEWIAAVAAALRTSVGRLLPRSEVILTEADDGLFTAKRTLVRQQKGSSLPETAFRIVDGRPSPPLPAEWVAALRGCRIVFRLNPGHVLFRPLEFPQQATEFLGGMIRAQIDRLTPWSAPEAVFGWSEPAVVGDRVQLILAATAERAIEPLVALGERLGAQRVAGVVHHAPGDGEVQLIKVFDVPVEGAPGPVIDVPRALRLGLLGAAAAAAATLAVSTYVVNGFDVERQQIQHQIAERRAALRLNQNGSAGSAQAMLVKRKQTTPATVMVLESISKALPDGTYVTELHIEGDKVQIVGVTQDAPPLIRLIEQSPQFIRATFFAPTTRSQSEPGERFHIEAHLKPYFGPAS